MTDGIDWPMEMDRRNRELAAMTCERDRLIVALREIAAKKKMDAVAAVAMRAIALTAINGKR
jgi:hypothetical protein